ncbi:aldehyde dehydrogenase family protein [Paraglaciecola chathamensis]|uniref:Betaine-aldehyde dehydrogenase n=1 Tax=Paraglaciecola agarilytica NO2 TaxID=1125747 RepID=A0ABQ0I377_9ALTE|nr:aldehyde dehydrogenase family protein [Paraglaciecola agarilytica]GAC03758.1 betaine-aldehyde dehydrogenase [Paraglaciecola agarilytica NO2]
MKKQWNHFIEGTFFTPTGGEYIQEFRPMTGELGEEIARGSVTDVDAAVTSANAALHSWKNKKQIERGRVLMAIARDIRNSANDFARQEADETGKPLKVAAFEVELCAQYFEYYGGVAPALHGEQIDLGPNYHCYTTRDPFGVIGVILPWNAPMNQAGRAIAPALAAGNTVVVKPSEFTSISLLQMAQMAVDKSGLPPGVFNVVTGTGKETGEPLVVHPLVRKLAFTGSVRAGREIGKLAGDRILPLTLELGGKSPNIIFEDADLDKAIHGSIMAFTINSGQVCLAGTRALVHESIFEEFSKRIATAVKKLQVSDGIEFGLGPMTTKAQYDQVGRYYEVAKKEGAKALVGGEMPRTNGGWYVAPTVYTNVTNDMSIAQEEVFGPVLVLIPFKDEEEAVAIANDTEYGLAAGLWTKDISRAHRIASKIEAGQVFVNEYPSGGVETPFGGYKKSGFGREKGLEALHHYTQTKTTIIRL